MCHKPLYLLELLILLPVPILCDVCDFSALPITSVPVQNVTFDIEGTINSTSVRRGLSMSIGTPPQFLAWGLGPEYNNSYVFSDKKWETGSTLISEDEYSAGVGGLFIENSSSTWTKKSDMSSAGASTESSSIYSTVVNDTWGTDTIRINTSYHLSDVPIDIISNGHTIGLGKNSTFLNALKASGAIASRTWSVFWGLNGFESSAQMEGVTVFGGYDQAKITGENLTVPLTMGTTCPSNMVISVLSMDLQFPDGQNINLETGPIKYCIDPGFHLLSLHPDTLTKFNNNAGGTYLGASGAIYEDNHAQLYLTNEVFDGSLNLTLDGGPSIIIPNDQLVVPDYTLQDNGTVTFNESERVVLVSQGSANGITLIGQPFLTAAYLMVTQDTNPPALTLWSSNNNASNDFAAIDSNGNICTSSGFAGTVVPDGNSTASDGNSTASPSAAASASSSSTPSKSSVISGGAIAGIVIGVLALFLIISGGIIVFRRRRRGNSSEPIDSHASVATELQPRWSGRESDYVDESVVKSELPAESIKAELPGDGSNLSAELQSESYQRIPRYEMD